MNTFTASCLRSLLCCGMIIFPTQATQASPTPEPYPHTHTTLLQAPVLDDGKVEAKLPYSQSFDNENNDYDGTTYVPQGWLSTGTTPFITASVQELPAVTGTYYLIAPESTVARDERTYTSFFLMNKGKTYTLTFYLYMPGGDTGNTSNFDFTVGTEQDAEFHSPLLSLTDVKLDKWTKQTVTFTPQEDNYYCFAFALSGPNVQSGYVAIEDFTIEADGLVLPPKTAFSFDGVYSLYDSSITCFKNTKLQMVNQTQDAVSYLWEVSGPKEMISTEENPAFSFDASGTYTIKLTAKNAGGEKSVEETALINYVTSSTSMALYDYNQLQSTIIQSDIPTFSTDELYDFITGPNHHYLQFGEYFALAPEHEYTITGVSFYLLNYNLLQTMMGTEPDKVFSVVVYGSKDGKPDKNMEWGRWDTTLRQTFGSSGTVLPEMRMLNLPNPIKAKGPFFIAFEFADDISISVEDSHLTRTYLSLCGVKHRTQNTTLYVRPTSVPETATFQPDGAYHAISELNPEYAGWGLNLTLWVNTTVSPTVGIALAADGSVAFAARMANSGNSLQVSGTHTGETVRVYDLTGRLVASQQADGAGCNINAASLPTGTYIVKAQAGSCKITK